MICQIPVLLWLLCCDTNKLTYASYTQASFLIGRQLSPDRILASHWTTAVLNLEYSTLIGRHRMPGGFSLVSHYVSYVRFIHPCNSPSLTTKRVSFRKQMEIYSQDRTQLFPLSISCPSLPVDSKRKHLLRATANMIKYLFSFKALLFNSHILRQ